MPESRAERLAEQAPVPVDPDAQTEDAAEQSVAEAEAEAAKE